MATKWADPMAPKFKACNCRKQVPQLPHLHARLHGLHAHPRGTHHLLLEQRGLQAEGRGGGGESPRG